MLLESRSEKSFMVEIIIRSAVIRAKKEDVCFSEFNIKLGKEGWIFGSLL